MINKPSPARFIKHLFQIVLYLGYKSKIFYYSAKRPVGSGCIGYINYDSYRRQIMKKCCFCNTYRPLSNFLVREDRINGRYAACNTCMISQVRDVDWPPKSKRGGGLLWWDLDVN